jgi:catechol 2,3-dioxygenase
MNTVRLPATTHIGYAHLRVANLLEALHFYREMLGFREIAREKDTVALSANGSWPAQIILTEQRGARAKPPRTTGLYHVAIRLPDRRALARVFRRLAERGWPLNGAADHGVSEAFYLPDPENNGIELYTDWPRDRWPWQDGQIAMLTADLNLPNLLAQAHDNAPWEGIDPATEIGHIHLQVSDLARAETFYCDLLGLDVTQRSYSGALFAAAGDYHHHLGMNVWAGQGAPPAPPETPGLIAFSLVIPDEQAWQAAIERLQAAGFTIEEHPDGAFIQDDNQIGLVLTVG